MHTQNLAIMLTDIKGFTARTAGSSRAETQQLLARHRELVLPVIESFRGRLVKTIGDAFLVVFNSPTDAVLCGVAVQERLKENNDPLPQRERIEIRIAINAGEVAVHEDGDIYGEPVNITSRLESIAEAGQVFFTEAVYLAMNKREVPSSEIGYRQFKGISDRIKVYRVLRETPVGAQPPGPAADSEAAPAAAQAAAPAVKTAGRRRRLVSLLLDLTVMALALQALGFVSCSPDVKIRDRSGRAAEFRLREVKLSEGGAVVKGEGGEEITLGKGGVTGANAAGRELMTGLRTGTAEAESPAQRALLKFAKTLLWVLYCGLMMWRFGGTAGMKIMRLKAVDSATGLPAGADKAFLRAAFSLVSFAAAGLGYLWALWEKDRLTWHDLVSGTRLTDAG